MKISLVQYSPEWENKNTNAEKIDELITSENPESDLIIFPEMTLTGFTMSSEDNAEEIDGFSIKYFLNKAKDLKEKCFCRIN